jgi:selenocysteine-specific elongation factor
MAHLIGTAGHVDHGKTTLIKALTGIDADRLPEEKSRGMTIDIGFAHVELPDVGRVSIVDVPGHRKFLTNMLVGALGVDVGLLCVAADAGVMPQTREHLEILQLLPVDRLVVAMTRSDLVDAETRELARLDVEEFLTKTRFAGSPIWFVSAITGEGIDDLKAALSQALKQADPQASRGKAPWYLPIDRAFVVKGHGCVVTGTLAQGVAKAGDRAVLEPGGLEVRVRSIHVHGETVESSEFGRRTAVNLGGIHLEDVQRGMILAQPGVAFESAVVDCKLHWAVPPRHGQRIRFAVGSEEAIGKLFLSEADATLAQLRLERPIACAVGQPVIVRQYSPPTLIAGGRIVTPVAKPRKRRDQVIVVNAGDDETAVLQVIGDDPNGRPTEDVCRILGRSPQQLGPVFERLRESGALLGFAGQWIKSEAFEAGVSKFLEALGSLHEQSPTTAFVPREKAVSLAGLKWAGKPLDRMLSLLAQRELVAVQGVTIRQFGFRVQLTPRQRELLDRVLTTMDSAGVNVPPVVELAKQVPAPPQAVEEILKIGVQAGEVVALGEGIYYGARQLERIQKTVADAAAGKPFTASAMRDVLGTTRKYIIPLLEHMDSIRFTLRQGDQRVVRSSREDA